MTRTAVHDAARRAAPLDHDMTNEELTQLAKCYYIDGLTQEELAQKFAISRPKVGRLLKRAIEEGIVEIRVRHHPRAVQDLEQELVTRFGIQRAIISVDHKDQDSQRELLAGLVASYLDRVLADGAIVAVGMGRNVSAVSRHAVSTTQRNCSFVSAIGGSYRGGETMNADHICRRLAARFGGESETLYAPALVNDPQLFTALLENDVVRQSLDKARRASIALVGIGDILEDSNMVRMGWFTPEEMAEAKRAGAVGDIMGYDFIDIHGRPATTMLHGRVIGLTLEDLKRIPNVIATASEPTKATGILGALRAGVINTLATTQSIAQTVLSLAQATETASAA
ncbi:sugar-binding protein [Burkholderia pseudomallei]|nr:sugar-binding transcriptional regulator [Burkholderia pseudomallei]MBF3754474.1 sugar-binding transcriptional regulator [Burkholderia pseudomallei]MDE3329271.1 sugar-binding transcriptional regulator [Burkholderia pseudomallei]MXP97806.1 winged helix-turn-helix transcriptional regulator [Burkholderia pseudomallei]MXQ35550.1 winged helix-turn-helix transcriptional regulator [Burkholderia pseudomallei]OMR56520.1 DNA-binding protein [Burkholderia pseudomallei]